MLQDLPKIHDVHVIVGNGWTYKYNFHGWGLMQEGMVCFYVDGLMCISVGRG